MAFLRRGGNKKGFAMSFGPDEIDLEARSEPVGRVARASASKVPDRKREPQRGAGAVIGSESADALFAMAGEAVFITDVTLRVTYLNAAARVMLQSDGPILLQAGELRFRTSTPETSRLGQAIRDAHTGIFTLPCNSGEGEMSLRVVLQVLEEQGASQATHRTRILLTAARKQNIRHWLVGAFGLTRVEAELAVLLAAGNEVAASAERMKISVHTARKYLQSVFEKTGVRRQVNLVTLLHRQYGGAYLPE